MSQTKRPFVLEGDLLNMWIAAQKDFLEGQPEFAKSPQRWLQSFQEKRHSRSDKLRNACNKVGSHLQVIQNFMQIAQFTVNVASSVVPIASPASLIVNAFAWLFDSFAKVSEDFDKIENFFKLIASRLQGLSIINAYLGQQNEPGGLRRCIVDMFVCCLNVCKIASEQVQHRGKKLLKQVSGNDELGPALDGFTTVDDALRFCLGIETVKSTMKTQEVAQRIETAVYSISEFNSRELRDEILDWLSPLDYPNRHKQIKQQFKGGNWLVTSELFGAWKEEGINRIWYTGKPGAGKSVLVSIIIDHLKSWAQEKSSQGTKTTITYLYLSYLSPSNMTTLLGSILRQLQTEGDLHPEVLRKFKEYRQDGKYNGKVQQLSLDDIKSLLLQACTNKSVFVVIDALDEFKMMDRGPLLQHIRDMNPDVKILVTSRVLEHLHTLQKGFETREITAHDDDMDEYIKDVIQSSPELRSFPELHDEIKTQVKRKSGRMFIIVRLHMKALTDVQFKPELENILKKLPDNIDDAYKYTLDRIRTQSGKEEKDGQKSGLEENRRRDLAISTLGWITYAQRQLSMLELQHALEIEKSACIGSGYSFEESKIISACCGLVIQEIDGTVRAVHRSAWEFFDRVKGIEFPNFDKRITLACAKYLSMPSLQLPTSTNHHRGRRLETSLQGKYPLARYAGEYLHKHHRQVQNLEHDDDVLKEIQRLVLEEATRTLYSQLLFAFDAYDRSRTVLDVGRRPRIPRQRMREPLQPLHIAVYLGNPELVKNLIDDEQADVNALDPYEQSALVIAIKNGLDTVAGILLDRGATIDLSTKKGHAILLYAAERDYTTVIKRIIGSPSGNPIDEGFLKILGILLLIMFEMLRVLNSLVPELYLRTRTKTLQTTHSSPPDTIAPEIPASDSSLEKYIMLLQSAYAGDLDSLHMLLESSVHDPINLKLPFLEDDESNVNYSGSDMYDDETYDYDSMSDYDEDETSAGWGSDGSTDRVQVFKVESSSDEEDSDAEDESDRTDQENEKSDHEDANETSEGGRDLPLETDIIEAAFVRSACFLAIESGKHKAVELFLQHGISPDLCNFQGQSLLHRATARNDYKLVKLLIERNVNVNQRDRNGRTALMANADVEKDRVLKLLIDRGADIHLTQREGCHELYEAAVFGATKVVRFFLEHGIDPSITNNFGWTPLHGAAANGHLECVRYLLDKGANPSPVSDTSMTPRDFVESGMDHYDHILTGGVHYKAQIMQAKERTVAQNEYLKDEIMNLLVQKGALTSMELGEKIGSTEFRNLRKHRSWRYNSWWDKGSRRRRQPWYRHRG